MENNLIESRLADIQHKLAVITEEIEMQKRRRQEMEELKSDLTIIAKDIFSAAVHELDDVAPFVKTGDFTHLVKKLLRNIDAISGAISKFESAIGFMEDAAPLTKGLFDDALTKLDALDRKGYFEFWKSLGDMMDSIVTNLPPEQMKRLSENVIILIDLIKLLADTNFLKALQTTMQTVENTEPNKISKFSLWIAYKELSTPEMRQNFGYLLFFFKTLAGEIKK